MGELQCAVCKKMVDAADTEAHLLDNHLGPHRFWMDCREYKITHPSLTVTELRAITNGGPCGHGWVMEERTDGRDVSYGDSESVDLTHQPRFYILLPASW